MSVTNGSVSIPVAVELETRHQGGEPEIRRYAGLLYPKPRGSYLVYEEAADAGVQTRTTVRFGDGELKLVRRGAVESEQAFAARRVTQGWDRLPNRNIALETPTAALRVDTGASDEQGMAAEWPRPLNVTAEWQYDLKLGGEPAGNFEIRLHIREEE